MKKPVNPFLITGYQGPEYFKYAGIYGDLKELLGREVDFVQNGALKAFAVESAEQDKILIYERAN